MDTEIFGPPAKAGSGSSFDTDVFTPPTPVPGVSVDQTGTKVTGNVEPAGMGFTAGRAVNKILPKEAIPTLRILGEASRLGQLPLTVSDALFGTKASPEWDQFLQAAYGTASPVEKLAASGVLGGTTGAATRSIGPLRGIVSGIMGDVGGEAGGRVAQAAGVNPLWGQIPGSIVGGLPGMIPGAGTAENIVGEALKGFTPSQLSKAINMQRQAGNIGLELRPSQLFGDSGYPLLKLESMAINSPVGKGLLEQRLNTVGPSATNVSEGLTNQFGPVVSSTDRANQVETAVENLLKLPKTMASQQAGPEYQALQLSRPQLSVNDRFDLASRLEDLNQRLAFFERSKSGRAVGQAEKVTTENSPIINPQTGTNFRLAQGDVMSFDSYLKELQQRIQALDKPGASGADAAQRAGLTAAADEIRTKLLQASPELAQAKDLYSTVRGQVGNVVRTTPLADMAPRATRPANEFKAPAKWDQFMPMIESRDPNDIKRTAMLLDTVDPQAFGDITKNWISSTWQKTVGSGATPAQFSTELLSNPNIDTLVAGTARSMGMQDPNGVAGGFKNALLMLKASGQQIAKPGTADLQQILAADPAAMIGRGMVGSVLSKSAMMVHAIQSRAFASQYKKLYDALSDPDSMAKLAELSRISPMSPRAASLLSSIVGGTVSTGGQGNLDEVTKATLGIQ